MYKLVIKTENEIECKELFTIKVNTDDKDEIENLLKYKLICPLCNRVMQDSNKEEDNYLTNEHVPPKSVGGKVRCRTCKKCNNESGDNFDYSIESLLNSLKFDYDILNYNAGYTRCGLSDIKRDLSLTMTNNIDEVILNIDSKNSNPKVIDYIKSSKDFNLILKNPHKKEYNLVNLSLLKAAYLYYFSIFGYSNIFSEPLQKIRTNKKS